MSETNIPTEEEKLLQFLPKFRHFIELIRKCEDVSPDRLLQLLGPWVTRVRPAIPSGTPNGEKEMALLELLLSFMETHHRPPTEEELSRLDLPWPISASWPWVLFQPDVPKEQVVNKLLVRRSLASSRASGSL